MIVSFCALQMSKTLCDVGETCLRVDGDPNRFRMPRRRIAFGRQTGGEFSREIRPVCRDGIRLADAHAGDGPAGASTFW